MRISTRYFMITVVLAATSACTLGTFQSETHAVELRNETDVANCTMLGTVTEKTRDRWTPTRNDIKIATELRDLARQEAANLGGNTLVEKTALIMGSQTFAIYNCS